MKVTGDEWRERKVNKRRRARRKTDGEKRNTRKRGIKCVGRENIDMGVVRLRKGSKSKK